MTGVHTHECDNCAIVIPDIRKEAVIQLKNIEAKGKAQQGPG